MLLTEVYKYLECKKIYNLRNKDLRFKNIYTNSKNVTEFSIFVISNHIKNKKKYIEEAVNKGAIAIITNKYFKNIKITQFIVQDINSSLSILLHKLKPHKPVNSIAVTGTNGKTSVVWYIAQICYYNKILTKSYGTLGYYINCIKKSDSILTTPENEILHQTAFSKNKNSYNYIFEASSHALHQDRLKNFPIEIAAITNLSKDHLDYHKNFKSYKDTKLTLFTKYLKPSGLSVLNEKIHGINFLKRKLNKTKVITYGLKNSDIFLSFSKKNINVKYFNKNYILKINNFSLIDLENISCAIACCHFLKINIKKIISSLYKIKSPPGRIEKVILNQSEYEVYIDYAHTPDALKRILLSKAIKNKKPDLVFGCGGDRYKEKRSMMGLIANKYAGNVYITDDNPRSEDASKIRKRILDNCKKGIEIPSRKEAINKAIEDLRKNNILLIAGKGHEKFQINNKSISKFDDLEIARSALKQKIFKEKVTEYLFKKTNVVKINSEDILKGDVFLALLGKNHHGNKYISEAIKKGAKYIITDVKPKKNVNEKIVVVDNIFDFLLKIAKEKRQSYFGKVIGITGSVGKTSVKENLKYCLSKYFKVSASIKSYNNFLGVIISLINFDLKSKFAIFELGTNNFLEIKTLTKLVEPSQIIITNIFPNHLEKLKSTRNIAIEKSDIFNKKYNQNIELAILPNDNLDEKFLFKKAMKNKISKILTFGNNSEASIKILKKQEISKNFLKVYLRYKNKNIEFILHQSQIYRINNFLICILIFLHNNIKLNSILPILKKIPLVEGRGLQKKIYIKNKKISLIDESYNSNPETMRICIDYFSSLKVSKNQKKIMILGDMKELGENSIKYHSDLINYITNKNLQNVIICGEFMKIALEKNKNNKIKCFLDNKLIIKYIDMIIKTGDIILIKGSNTSMTNTLAKKFLNKGIK